MSSPSSPSPDLDSERLHYLRSPICTIKPSFPWGQTPRKGERWFYAQRQDVSFSRKVAVHSCPPPRPDILDHCLPTWGPGRHQPCGAVHTQRN